MTREAVILLLEDLFGLFPSRQYREMDAGQTQRLVDTWALALGRHQEEAIRAGLAQLMQTQLYFPKPAELIAAAQLAAQGHTAESDIDRMAQRDAAHRAENPHWMHQPKPGQ